jgi:hypothetical protein
MAQKAKQKTRIGIIERVTTPLGFLLSAFL